MKRMRFKDVEAILFDFEGTLVDCQWNVQQAVQETLDRLRVLGFPIDRLKRKKYSVLNNEAMVMASEIGYSSEQVKEVIGAIYDRFDADALLRWHIKPQAKECLSFLKASGIQMGLVSNVGRKVLEKAVMKLEISPWFQLLISRNDVQYLKPNSEGIRLALNHLRVQEEKTFFVGDSLDDMQAAKDAGLKVIILSSGEYRAPELLSEKPDLMIQDYGELIACFKEERI